MNLPVTVKDAQLQTQVKLQIPRIEAHKDKGRTAGNLDIFKHILSPLVLKKSLIVFTIFYRIGQKKTQDFKRGKRCAQLVTGTFFEKMSL